MKVASDGYGEKLVTFGATEGTLAGVSVMMGANGAAAPCAAGEALCGVVVNVRGGFAAVQLAGYVRLPYTGTTSAIDYQTFAGDDVGKIETDATGWQFLVADMDTPAAICGVIL